MPLPTLAQSDVASDTITIVLARWVATVASDGFGAPQDDEIIPYGAVAVENGRIAAIGTRESVREKYAERRTVEVDLSSRHILIPGLVNCHTHLAMSFLKGYADDMALCTWLNEFIWPTEKAIMSKDFVYHGTALAIMEALKTGTTMLNDMYFMPEAAMQAVHEAGIRCVHGTPVLDFGDGSITQQFNDAIDLIRKVHASAHADSSETSRVRASFTPHAAYTVSGAWMAKGCKEIAPLNDATPHAPVIFHTHLHETIDERQKFEEGNGAKTALQVMDEAGAVNERMVAAHCVHMKPEEIDLMAQRRANVCHCPKSNLKLASGFCPVWDMLKAGVNVCLGTDGGCSNNSLDMLSEMQYAAMVAKGLTKDPTAVDAYTALRIATRNGVRALGRLHELGSLEVGKFADLVAIDLYGEDDIGLPVHDPISHLVYTTHTKVTDVWIGGRHVLNNGAAKTLQLHAAQHADIALKLHDIRTNLVAKCLTNGAEPTA